MVELGIYDDIDKALANSRTTIGPQQPDPGEKAVVAVKPDTDPAVIKLQDEIQKLLKYSEQRKVATIQDVESATNDLAIMSNLKKSVEEKRREYLKPLRDYTDAINSVFKSISEPLVRADKITRDKVLAFRQYQEKLRQEAEAIERMRKEAEERARKLTEETGELIDKEPETEVIVPLPSTGKMSADLGTSGLVENTKWDVEDFSLVPDKYKVVNATLVGRIVRAGGEIPGIKVWKEAGLRVMPKGGQ